MARLIWNVPRPKRASFPHMTAVGMERCDARKAGLQVEQQVESLLALTSPAKARLARIRTRGGHSLLRPRDESGFAALVRGLVATALEQQELPAREDPDRLPFELHGIMLAADNNFVLHDDPTVTNLARQIVRQRLGLCNGGNASESGGRDP